MGWYVLSVWTIAEQFLELNNLYFKTDVYSERKLPFEMFSPDNPKAVGKDFDFKKYMESSNLEFWRCIKDFVYSEIPNCFFTLPWDEFFDSKKKFPDWLKNNKNLAFAKEYLSDSSQFSFMYDKTYWEYFAIILACRGAERVIDVSKPILNIFVDINRFGIFPLQCLVANNIPLFKNAIVECIYKAIDNEEEYWSEYLVALLSLRYSFDGNAIKLLTKSNPGYKDVLHNVFSGIT